MNQGDLAPSSSPSSPSRSFRASTSVPHFAWTPASRHPPSQTGFTDPGGSGGYTPPSSPPDSPASDARNNAVNRRWTLGRKNAPLTLKGKEKITSNENGNGFHPIVSPDRAVGAARSAVLRQKRNKEYDEEVQRVTWTLLYTFAASLSNSRGDLPHFAQLVQKVALLLPDPVARPIMMDLVDNETWDITCSEDALLALWSLHQKLNARLSHPFVFLDSAETKDLSISQLVKILKEKWLSPSMDSTENSKEDEWLVTAIRLPDEVLFYMFDIFPVHLLHVVSTVCRRWRRLSSDSSLWKGRFLQRWIVVEPAKWEIVLMSQSWKGLYFQWFGWDRLEEKFYTEDSAENLIFEMFDEEWIEEEVEVAVLSEEDVTDESDEGPSPSSSSSASSSSAALSGLVEKELTKKKKGGVSVYRQHSFRERRKKKLRRRRRLSLELERMMVSNQGMRGGGGDAAAAAAAGGASRLEDLFNSGDEQKRSPSRAYERQQFGVLPDLMHLVPPLCRTRRFVEVYMVQQNEGEGGASGILDIGEGDVGGSGADGGSGGSSGISVLGGIAIGGGGGGGDSGGINSGPPSPSGAASPPGVASPLMHRARTVSANSALKRHSKGKSASQIKFATLTKLIEYLTSPWEHDLEFLKTFMLTFENFTTPQTLLKLLLRRYFTEPPLEDVEMEEWKKSVLSPIQLRVFNVLKTWVEKYYSDFMNDAALLKCLETFAKRVLASGMSNQILKLLQQKQTGVGEPAIQHQFSKAAPYPEVPKNLFSPTLQVWHIGELELARQLTIVDFQLFSKIKAREFYFYGHDKARAPNVIIMYDRFRGMAKWIADEIANRDKHKHRVKLVKRLISLAGHLLKLNNFNSLMAVVFGLNQWAVLASSTKKIYSMVLHFTDLWGELSKRDRKDFECIEQLMINEGLYQETLEHIPGHPRIPYLDFHLNKIMSVEAHIPSIVGDVVNFSKSKYLYNLISQLIQYQENPYNLQPVQTIIDLLNTVVFKQQ